MFMIKGGDPNRERQTTCLPSFLMFLFFFPRPVKNVFPCFSFLCDVSSRDDKLVWLDFRINESGIDFPSSVLCRRARALSHRMASCSEKLFPGD